MVNLLTSMGQKGYTFYDFVENIAPEVWSSLIIMTFICIMAVILGKKAKAYNPLTRPTSNLVLLGEFIVGGISGFVENMMGKKLSYFAPYFTMIAIYLPLAFLCGLVGLPSPVSNMAVPLCLAIVTFAFIHITAIKYKGIKGWLHRFIEPFPVFLPINLLTVWSIIISLTCRILGNALAGGIILTLIYWGTDLLSSALLGLVNLPGFNFLGPLIAGPFHAYFDIFGSFIQTLVFLSLSALFIAQELPGEE